MPPRLGKLARLALCVTIAGAQHAVASAAEPQCPQPDQGPVVAWVQEPETAIRLAKALVEGRGDFTPYNDRPLGAELRGDTWVVATVRPPCPPMQVEEDGSIIVCGHGDHTAVVEITVYGKIKRVYLHR